MYRRIDIIRKYNISDARLRRLVEFGFVKEMIDDRGHKRYEILKDYDKDVVDKLIKQRMREILSEKAKQLHQNKEWSEKRSQSIRNAYKSEELRNRISDSCKKTMSTDKYRKKRSETSKELWANKDFRNKMLKIFNSEHHKKKLSLAIKASMTDEIKKKISDVTKASMTQEVMIKRHNSMIENSSYSHSKDHKECVELLKNAEILYQEEKLYPNSHLSCDLYLPALDLWIELHFDHFHNFRPYTFSKEDKEELEILLSKCTGQGKPRKSWNQYDYVVYNWTNLDLKRKELALLNELNWLAFYSKQEFVEWLNTLAI